MRNFAAMAIRLWEYKRNFDPASVSAAVGTFLNRHQLMALDTTGDMVLHVIEEGSDTNRPAALAAQYGIEDYSTLDFSTPYALVPPSFQQAAQPFLGPQPHSFKPDEQVCITWQGSENSFPAAFPLYQIAKTAASGRENYILCLALQAICMVAHFKNGTCDILNTFSVGNDSETLYYCMAIVKKAGLDVRKVKFEILGTEARAVLDLMHRFVQNASLFHFSLPYTAGEYPPDAEISLLLHQFLQCALPVAH